MEQQLEQIREQQRASWNKFAPGWKKWDELFMEFLQPLGDEMVNWIQPKDEDVILDVASGTGEPGLTMATMARNGKVVFMDVSENMLAIAREHALRKGITNFETAPCDVCELPFPDNTFDAVSCRLGFMFFPDMQLAAREMARVLKPGGRIAAAVWCGPEKNFWVTAIGGTINRNMQLEPPPPGAPGMFRCAKSGQIQDLFEEAGLKNTAQREVPGILKCGTADVYWDMMTEIAAPFVAALSKADDAMKEKIKGEVYQIMNEKYRDGNVMIESSAWVIWGEK